MIGASAAGVKETFLSAGGLPAGWQHHLARARRGAHALGLPWPGDAALGRAVQDAVAGHQRAQGALTGGQRLRVRLRLLVDAPSRKLVAAPRLEVDVTTLNPGDLDLAPRRLALGPRLRAPELPLAGCKAVAVAADGAARRQAQAAGFDDVLIRDRRGRFSETPIANLVFGLPGGRVVTPGPASGPVAGTLLARLVELDRPPWLIEHGDVAMTDLHDLHWAVMVNALRGAWPVAAIGDHPLRPPPAVWLLPVQAWVWSAKDDAVLDPGDDPLRQ